MLMSTSKFMMKNFFMCLSLYFLMNLEESTLLELHKLEEGSYPEKLAGLDEQLPTDPYSGKAYLYSTLPEAEKTGGYQLYGIGSNLKDDGGRIVLTEAGWVEDEEGDIVWRYSPPPTLLKIPKPGEN